MSKRWRHAASSAFAVFLLGYAVFVHLYSQIAEPFTPEPGGISIPALILGLPVATLAAVIVLAVVLAFYEVWDRA